MRRLLRTACVVFCLMALLPIDRPAWRIANVRSAPSIALIQNASTISGGASSITAKFSKSVTAGDLIVVGVSGWPSSGTVTVTDSLGDTYAQAGSTSATAGNSFSALFYAKNSNGGTDVITFGNGTAGTQLSIIAAEFSGIDTNSPLDSSANASGSNSAPSSGNMTPAVTGDLLIGSGTHDSTVTTTPGVNMTMVAIATENSSTYQPLAMDYQVLSSASPTSSTFALSSNSNWAQNGVLFRPAGGATGPTYSLSGSVSPSSSGSGSTIALSGSSTATVTADASGNFIFTGLANGNYTVTPSKSGFAFNPASQPVTISNGNATGITFTITPLQAGIQLIQKNSTGNEAATSTMAVSLPSNVTAGNFLIVSASAARPASTLTIADSAGDTFLPAYGPVNDSVQDVNLYVWYVQAAKGGPTTFTITPPAPAALEIHVSEWSGMPANVAVDQTSSSSGNGTVVSSGSKTTTANGELIFGYGWVFNTASAGTGFSPISLVNGDLDEYQIQTTAGSIAATFTQTSGTWFAVMVTFKAIGWGISGTITGGAGASITLSGPTSATVTADSSGNYAFNGLVNGSYTVTPSEPGFTMTPASQMVPVNGANAGGINFTATQLPPVLSISPTSIAFTASQGGNNPPAATVSLTNSGGGTFSYSTSSDSAWLTVSPASGTAPQTLQLAATSNGLAVGDYTGHVTVTATGVQGSPATITVNMHVGVATDWLMVDHDPSRSGYAADETTINTSNVSNLHLNWSAAVNGSVTAQPLYVHSIQIAGQTRDVLVVGTGGNSIYAFDTATGAVLWTRNFGPSTPSTYGLPDGFGIEAPPVIDRVTNRIYTVSTDGVFRTISLLNGTDVYPGLTLVANPVTNKVWGGLNKVGNSVYVAVGSNGGDVAPWAGQVYQVDVSAAPTLAGHFVVVPSIPNGGGGIWGYGGVSADPATGTVFAASAFDSQVNSNGNEGYTPYADSMMALTPQLNLLGYYQPSQMSTFPCGGAPCDLDFASTPIFFQPAGCPAMVAAGNKNGNLYLFKVSDLEASRQPWQVLPLNNPYDSIGLGGVAGVPAYSPVTNMLYIGDAGNGVTGVAAGLVALKFNTNCTMQVAWSNKLATANDVPNSTPTIANGVVFIGEGLTGIIHAYDAQTGVQLWQSGSQYGAAATFAAPIVAGGKLYAGSWSSFSGGGIVGAFSLSASSPTDTPTRTGTPTATATQKPLPTSTTTPARTTTPTVGSSPIATATPTSTRTATNTPVPSGKLGSTQITGGAFDTGNGNNLSVTQITTATLVHVSSMSVYVDTLDSGSPAYGLAIYTNNGTIPGTLVASAMGTLTTANGWNTLPVSATLAPNTTYWLAYNTTTTNDTHNNPYLVQGGAPGGWSGTVACCTFPSSVGGWTIGKDQYAIYASVS